MIFLRDIDGTGSLHPCAKNDPGAMEFVQVRMPTDNQIDAGLKAIGGGSSHMADILEKVYFAMISAEMTKP